MKQKFELLLITSNNIHYKCSILLSWSISLKIYVHVFVPNNPYVSLKAPHSYPSQQHHQTSVLPFYHPHSKSNLCVPSPAQSGIQNSAGEYFRKRKKGLFVFGCKFVRQTAIPTKWLWPWPFHLQK